MRPMATEERSTEQKETRKMARKKLNERDASIAAAKNLFTHQRRFTQTYNPAFFFAQRACSKAARFTYKDAFCCFSSEKNE